MQTQADIWKPALIAGAIFGFLSGVPLLGALNCACCSLLLGAGALSAYLVIKGSAGPVTYGRGAMAGFVAGAFAAPVCWLTSAAFLLVGSVDVMDELRETLERASDVSPGFEDSAAAIEALGLPILLAFIGCFQLIAFAAFGTLGGVIGRALFERRSAAPPAAPGFGAGPIQPGPGTPALHS